MEDKDLLIWHVEHYDDVIMSAIPSQITSLTIVYSTVYPGADESKHQNSASLAFVWGIHRGPVNSPHKWPVTRKMFPFDDVIMNTATANGMMTDGARASAACYWPALSWNITASASVRLLIIPCYGDLGVNWSCQFIKYAISFHFSRNLSQRPVP